MPTEPKGSRAHGDRPLGQRAERGAITVLAAISIPVLISLFMLVYDFSVQLYYQERLQAEADSAVQAIVSDQQMITIPIPTKFIWIIPIDFVVVSGLHLPSLDGNPQNNGRVRQVLQWYGDKGVSMQADSYPGFIFPARRVHVTATATPPRFFGRWFHADRGQVHAESCALAWIGPPKYWAFQAGISNPAGIQDAINAYKNDFHFGNDMLYYKLTTCDNMDSFVDMAAQLALQASQQEGTDDGSQSQGDLSNVLGGLQNGFGGLLSGWTSPGYQVSTDAARGAMAASGAGSIQCPDGSTQSWDGGGFSLPSLPTFGNGDPSKMASDATRQAQVEACKDHQKPPPPPDDCDSCNSNAEGGNG